jgi:predicted transcriptional regulator
MSKPTESMSITLRAETARKLRAEADARMVAPSKIVQAAVERFLAELPPLDPMLDAR